MTSASLILTLVGINLTYSLVANPITPNDVKEEILLVSKTACQDKLSAQTELASSMPTLVQAALISGTASIENKLAQSDTTATITPMTTSFASLDKKTHPSPTNYKLKQYSCHTPRLNAPTFLSIGAETLKHIPANLHTFNIINSLCTIQAPKSLTFQELEDYINLRVDANLQTGSYWQELHLKRLTPEDLAKLRWFDYLDENTEKQSVTVYTCAEYQLR